MDNLDNPYGMKKMTSEQEHCLAMVCDTFLASLEVEGDQAEYWKRKGTDLNVHTSIWAFIQQQPEKQRNDFDNLLALLNSKLSGLSGKSGLNRFVDLSFERRVSFLQTWSKSPIPLLRGGFLTLKKLCGLLYYGSSTSLSPNPNWEDIGYAGPLKNLGEPLGSAVEEYHPKAKELSFDVIVVGSGAGGGVAAFKMAQKGYSVLVLEKGDLVNESEMDHREVEMMMRLYDRKAALTNSDNGISILAGSCVGGGTTVNWSASLRTPDYILEQWAKDHENPHFLNPMFKTYFEEVEGKLGIGTETSKNHNFQNKALWDGAHKLGYRTDLVPRNVLPKPEHMDEQTYFKAQGYGGLGDKTGSKQGTLKTYLPRAIKKGAKLMANFEVLKILSSGGSVSGVEGLWKKDGKAEKKIIKAKKVILAAGAIHSPSILQRSGLVHPELGRNLYLHPTNAVLGEYEADVKPWEGPMMSAYSNQFAQLDGAYGYLLETPPIHPGFYALSNGWLNPRQYKEDMLKAKKMGGIIVLTRDKFGGKVSVDKKGVTSIKYQLNAYDKKHLIHGMCESIKIHSAAGAKKVKFLHNQMKEAENTPKEIETLIKSLQRSKWDPTRFILYSAHQMGTCRMGGMKKKHPVRPDGTFRGIKGLWITDGSIFPECSGVNPMLSIMALSSYICDQISK